MHVRVFVGVVSRSSLLVLRYELLKKAACFNTGQLLFRHALESCLSRPLDSFHVFPGYLGIQKALRAVQQDARGSSRSFAEVALAIRTLQTVQDLWKGMGIRHAKGVWVL